MFDANIGAVIREVGDRGKTQLPQQPPPPASSEATSTANTTASAPTAAPAVVPAPATAPPSRSSEPMMTAGQSLLSPTVIERLLDDAKADRAAMEARLTAMEAKIQAKDERIAELMAPAPAAISVEQLAALQTRLGSLHEAKLLADEVSLSSPRHCHCASYCNSCHVNVGALPLPVTVCRTFLF